MYEKTIWDENTAITIGRLNKQEQGIAQAQADVDAAITQATQNVIDGKTLISNAINTKRVVSTPSMTFQQLADKVSEINLNKRVASGEVVADSSGNVLVSGLPFQPSFITVSAFILNYPYGDGYDISTNLPSRHGIYERTNYNQTPETRTYSLFVYETAITINVNGFSFSASAMANKKWNWVAYE